MKYLLDTNVYISSSQSEDSKARFRTTFFPLLPFTYLSAVVAYELSVSAIGDRTRRLVQEFLGPVERAGRLVTPTFADWVDAAEIVSAIWTKDRSWRSKLPTLLNDILIALCARRLGATLITYNAKDFRLIRRHKDFLLQVLDS